jgi:uncharacterized membrane protein YedE/YeeE
MVTFLIIAAVASIIVGFWILNKQQAEDLKEINSNVHPFIDDLAPEATPAPVAETIAKKKAAKKKPTTVKKTPAKKVAKKTTKK